MDDEQSAGFRIYLAAALMELSASLHLVRGNRGDRIVLDGRGGGAVGQQIVGGPEMKAMWVEVRAFPGLRIETWGTRPLSIET
jgi:hypothetical protein